VYMTDKYTEEEIDNLKKLFDEEYTYPETTDDNFQEKIYKKREFYYNKMHERPHMETYEDIRKYRTSICTPTTFSLLPQQIFLSNYINPDTPYKGVLIMHGTGVGKCIIGSDRVYVNGTLETIENIWSSYNTGVKIVDQDGGEWSNPKYDLYVNSYDEIKQRMIIGTVSKLYRQRISETMREITLENGNTIHITQIHKLYKNNKWTNELFVDDTISVFDQENNTLINSKIKSIREYDYTGYVYDLEIKEHHNFVAEGILVHNTCAGISIAEKFKSMVHKYGTKIYVLVSGPIIKETWKNALLQCTGEAYLKMQDTSVYINDQEKQKVKKNALAIAMQYYRFMSYRSFYKKVLGEKIVEKVKTADNKIKVTYRKTEDGEFERDVAIDRIYNLNNSLVIVDEAHNLTGNAYGDALMKVIQNSVNLKIVLLTATPMKNLADDIVELVNFLRPYDDPILRDKIFTSEKNHEMNFKPGGEEYLKKMTSGYVSYLRGADPMTFAKRVEKGVIPNGLLFTSVVQCDMLPFQRKIYDETIKLAQEEDTLDRKSEAVANFAFPGLSPDKKEVVGYYGREGVNIVKNQIKNNSELLTKKIANDILKNKDLENDHDLYTLSEDGKTISGKILQYKYLKYFSIKFYKALKKISRLYWNKKGPKTAFVYSNLVKVGIELFEEILKQNGYLEYDDKQAYKIKNDTICYFCGHKYKYHKDNIVELPNNYNEDGSESSSEYKKNSKSKDIPEHKFGPAIFVSVTGKSSEEMAEIIPEEKQQILNERFNNIDNIDGKFVKLVLGSKVMNEGVSLKNVAEVHILDVYFNLGKVDQVIGRGIRHCSHMQVMTKENPFPDVNIYKYAVSLGKNAQSLSSEEELYRKAELKYILIKKVERIIKENAIDCPLFRNKNIFTEEIETFKNCAKPGEEHEPGQITCSGLCDYMDCNFKCDSHGLNEKYFENNIYKNLKKEEIDYTTFSQSQNLARNEIDVTKTKIKELYRIKYVYTLKDIINYVKSTLDEDKKDLFDDFFIFKALDEMIPLTENDFNNFRDTIFDKYNRPGYLIYVDRYYIYQPFDQNEDVPMYYRSVYDKTMKKQLTLYDYIKNVLKHQDIKKDKEEIVSFDKKAVGYDFNGVLEYYEKRPEFEFVGIVDKESTRRKTKTQEELSDIFKIREKREKILDKKRGIGISSMFGAVCATAKSKEVLDSIAQKLNIKTYDTELRTDICKDIQNKLMFLEKYSTGKNKMTYMIIPSNHPTIKFPLNLADRKDHIINKIKEDIKFKLDVNIKEIKKTIDKINVITYIIEIKHNSQMNDYKKIFIDNGFKLEGNKWILSID